MFYLHILEYQTSRPWYIDTLSFFITLPTTELIWFDTPQQNQKLDNTNYLSLSVCEKFPRYLLL